MKLNIKKFKFLTGRPVCIIHENTAKKISLHVGARVRITNNRKKSIISVVDTINRLITPQEIAVSEEIICSLNLKDKETVEIELAERPESINSIKKKLKGYSLKKKEIKQIVVDIANNALTEVEVAFFVSAVYSQGMSVREIRDLTQAMIETGNQMKLKGKVIDKHSIGGVAGNRTTPIITSICAAQGLTMPKTSSRAITSAAGTADVMELVARVDFSVKEIKDILKKTNGCFVWGGAIGLAPVDDKIIKIERVVNIDSSAQLLASILSKKISVGSKYVLIDIPYGRSAKVNKEQAESLKKKFLELGKQFNLHLNVVLTDGSQPVGNGVGPFLEMVDVVSILKRDNPPRDLEERSLMLAGKLLEMSGKADSGKGINLARKTLESGEALKKFEQIITAQKGNLARLKKIPFRFSFRVTAKRSVKIRHLDNVLINKLARRAGCPEDKFAGVYIHKKCGETAKKGEPIITIYSVSEEKLKHAKKFYKLNEKQIVQYSI